MFRTVELEELGGAGLGGKLLGVGNGLLELGALGSSHDDGFGFGLVREGLKLVVYKKATMRIYGREREEKKKKV